jgi:hypothetical protein
MTHRIARLALAGAAATAAFALPAAPASAEGCINMGTTPVECLLELLATDSEVKCIRQGTFVYICPPVAG